MSDTATNPSFRIDDGEIAPDLKCEILVELWDTHKNYSEFDFTDLISYGDKLNVYNKAIKLLAGVRETTKQEESDIQEVYLMFLSQLGLTERHYTDLEDIFVHREVLLARGEIK
jgi:hypothetical protein